MTALFSSIRNLRTTSNSAIDEVCRFVTQNLAEPLTLTVAAEYVHMNPAYLSRVFKKEDRAGLQRLCERAAHPPRQAVCADERPHHRYCRKRRL